MEGKSTRKAARKARISELLKEREKAASLTPEEVKERKREKDKRDREATREIVRRQAANMDFSPGPSLPSSQVFTGPRGGRYRINSNGRESYDVP